MKSGIYQITTAEGRLIYIGSSAVVDVRICQHIQALKRKDHRNRILQRSWDKYGEAHFFFRKIVICSVENLLMYEQALIDGLKPEYNICKIAGATRGIKHSDESRKNMSVAAKRRGVTELQAKHLVDMANMARGKQRSPLSDEVKKKISEKLRGNTPSNETRTKLSKARKGIAKSEDHKKKIAAALKGKTKSPLSEDRKIKLSKIMLGKTHSESSKKKMSESMKLSHKRRKGYLCQAI